MQTSKSSRTIFALCLLAGAIAIGCSSGRSTTKMSSTTIEQPAPPPPIVAISIVGLHDVPTNDPVKETVVGTIVNQGDKPVSKLSIQVNSLDGTGRVVNTIVTPPLDQTIAPNGGQANFEAQVPRDPSVTTYHAVAVAR